MIPVAVALLFAVQPAPPVVSAPPVIPDDSKPAYRALSPPACADWRVARAEDGASSLRLAIYRMWVLGFVSGFNVVGPDPTGDLLGTSSPEEFYEAIDGYCQRNPSNSVADAMRPIAVAIIRRRQGALEATDLADGNKRRATIEVPATCEQWAEAGDDAFLRLARVSFLLGYLTAYNRWSSDPTGDAIGANYDSLVEDGIDTWCGEHPSGLLVGAIAPLIDHVAAERAAGRLPPGGMQPNDQFSPGSSTGP